MRVPPVSCFPAGSPSRRCRRRARATVRRTVLPLAACLAAWLAAGGPLNAAEDVVIKRNGALAKVAGRVLVEAQDGGILLEARDGRLWTVFPEELQSREENAAPFTPLSKDEVAQKLLAELPRGFKIHQTANYVVCYNTSPAYAEWCGALYERLFRGFYSYWRNRGLKLEPPEFPLVALVFDSRDSYRAYAQRELGEAVKSIIGYYNMRSNRVIMYDLTGIEGLQRRVRATNAARINQILSQPQAERTVATIVHEATHQLAYNSGLQVRYADNPFWVSEGLAVFFESPDLKSSKGWRTIGGINHVNLFEFRKLLRTRPADSLRSLIVDDRRFRDPQLAPKAYAEAWALNYFLFRTRSGRYVQFIKQLGEKRPLFELTPDQRLAEFVAAFGDLETLDAEFVRYMQRIR